MSFRWIPLLLLAWAPLALGDIDKSDFNGDGVVDALDLELFSNIYLEQDYETVDWCAFYESALLNPKYFRKIVSDRIDYYDSLFAYIAVAYDCEVIKFDNDKSDLNSDGVIDTADLAIFSTNYLQRNWQTVDWCVFHAATVAGLAYEGSSTKFYLTHFTQLLTFIDEYFACGSPPPPPNVTLLENNPKNLLRIADGTGVTGRFYMSDASVGSVFFLDEFLVPTGELKDLGRPLGVALDMQGRLLVGSDSRDIVEVYDPATGELLAFFGQGLFRMPTAITVDEAGMIYVTDSERDHVFVFDAAYNHVRSIGYRGTVDGALDFPMDTAVLPAHGVFVADRHGNAVKVFDFDGTYLRSITFAGVKGQQCSWWTGICQIPGKPPFTALQALASDSLGRLHVLDVSTASVMMFDPADGTFIDSYGGYGNTAGLLRVPMDVSISAIDMSIVTSGDGDRIEVFTLQ